MKKNEIICDIIKKGVDLMEYYGLEVGKLEIDINRKMNHGEVKLHVSTDEGNEIVTRTFRVN